MHISATDQEAFLKRLKLSIEKAEILWGNDNYCVSMRSVYSTVITTWYIMFGKSQIHKW